ncbi:MAG TPA: Do family serine endopeptidase [Terriglobales bacterium]|nr:Do family serine endopeptidase [Terriglobales bacterium]
MNARLTQLLERLKARRLAYTLTIALTLAVGILIGTVISHGVKGRALAGTDPAPLTVPPVQRQSSQFGQIAKAVEPSVVNINTDSVIKAPKRRRAPGGGGGDDDPFHDFFDRFFGAPDGGDGSVRERSLGSGVIVDSSGYIITNQHVIDNATRVRVKLMDDPPGVLHDAEIVGSDKETDLAVIKVNVGHPLKAAKIGNSESVEVGDWVLAIGSPFNLEETVTAGIISAKGRNIVSQRQFQSFLQTDAAINPGNSGGPLVNMSGEVIGINTAIYTESAGYEGVGFAMPSNTVAEVYNQLVQGPDHRVVRGSIGVEFNAQPSPAIARVYGGGAGGGVTIANVTPGGPADSAGLRTGDTIVSVNGKEVRTGDELVNEISLLKPGTKAKLGYFRDGKERDAEVTIADRAKLFAARLGDDNSGDEESKPTDSKLGLSVRTLTPDLADRLEVPAGKGVVVQDVKPGSFADDLNFSRGDIILQINKQPINSEEDFRRQQAQLKSGQDVVFLVLPRAGGRNGGTIFLAGTLP